MNRLLETLRVALSALWAHRLRSALTLLGIVIGIATIITVVSAVTGLNVYVEEQVFSLSPDVFIVSKFGIITGRDQFLAALRRKDLRLAEAERIAMLCDSCRDVGATVQGTKSLSSGSRRLPDVQMNGSTANLAELFNLDVVAGRFYTEAEVRHAAPVAVIGWDVQDELFPGLDPLGRTINVDGAPLRVIGLLRRQGAVFGQSQDKITWLPLTTYEKMSGRHRSVDIWVKAASLTAFPVAQDEVRSILRRMRGTSFREEDPFGMVTAEALQGLWRGISSAAFAMMILIASISLVVGGIVVMNIMLVSVTERTHEIGIRVSIGARRRDIMMQFLAEATVLAAIGGVIGTGLGLGTASLVARFSPFPTVTRPALVLTALALATSVGLVFGIWPSWRASRLDPIDALRSE